MLEILIERARQLGIVLTSEKIRLFQLYYEELVEGNRRVNLTAIREYEEVQIKHFLDSFTLLEVITEKIQSGNNFSLLDIGTGAGIPGIPLKLLLPTVRLVLLESIAKKTAFLQHLVTRLEMNNVEVITGRAEDKARDGRLREKFDLVVCRAVGSLSTIAELSLPFCRLGALFIAQKKGNIEEELKQSRQAISMLGGTIREVKGVNLEGLRGRFLVIIEKIETTPDRYPRRAGMPAKRPL